MYFLRLFKNSLFLYLNRLQMALSQVCHFFGLFEDKALPIKPILTQKQKITRPDLVENSIF